jgi:hypothetical protein
VSNEVHPASALHVRALDRRRKTSREQVRAVSDEIHTGKIRTVTDTGKPAVKCRQDKVHAQQAGNGDYGRTIARWNSHAVVNRGQPKLDKFQKRERFAEDRLR